MAFDALPGALALLRAADLLGLTDVNVLEESRDAGHREDALHGVASVHE